MKQKEKKKTKINVIMEPTIRRKKRISKSQKEKKSDKLTRKDKSKRKGRRKEKEKGSKGIPLVMIWRRSLWGLLQPKSAISHRITKLSQCLH